MQKILRTIKGKMNLDISAYKVPMNDYIDALNITRDSKGSAQDEIVANINGNVLVSYALPAGQNKCIGRYNDIKRNRIYFFVWNSNGYNLWLYYDVNANVIVEILKDLTDTSNIPVLKFDPSKRINHIDIVYRDDEGDLMAWVDALNTPKCANILSVLNNKYSTIKAAFIETAKKPFLSAPLVAYGDDVTRNASSLRKKMFQFSARPVYDDFQKATFSPYSKVPLPVGYYGSDNDTDSTRNNYINITVETGDENVSKIELFARTNVSNEWGDFVQIASLDKSELGIPDNATYQFRFYNDGIYPPIDVADAIRLFDWVPQVAGSQCMPNGDTLLYGDITEGYPQIGRNNLDVEITAVNQTNIPPDSAQPNLTYTITGGITWKFLITGVIPVGTVFKIIANVPGVGGILFANYTSIAGDTPSTVCSGLAAYVSANFPGYLDANLPPQFYVRPPVPGFYVITTQVSVLTPSSISTEKTWLWDCNYMYGIVYVDEQGRDMPGVCTYVDPSQTDRDFSVTTPSFSLFGTSVQTPVVTAKINHLPPAGAAKFYWVRRRLTYGNFLFYETCDFQSQDGYYYFCLANIASYKKDNSQFIYSGPSITTQSRIKVIAEINSSTGAFTGTIWNKDYEILGTVKRTMTGGTSPADDQDFIKVKIPSAPPTYSTNMLVMIYEPYAAPIDEKNSVYNEFSECYDLYNSSGIYFHKGQTQDQTGGQPAIFIWAEGDVYFHKRNMYKNKSFNNDPLNVHSINLMDANYSDFFLSAVNDNGRAQVIEVDAKRQRSGSMVRHGYQFEYGSNLNMLNRFDFVDFDEYDRSKGDIQKLFVDKKRMYVFHQFDTGVVPIKTQVIYDTSGNPLDANSDKLINKIVYPYTNGFGIIAESFAYGKGAMYGVDGNRAVIWRLSQDGFTPLSILYDINAFCIPVIGKFGRGQDNGISAPGQVYSGDPTIHGVFDGYVNKYIVAMEAINRYTIAGNIEYELISMDTSAGAAFDGVVPSGVPILISLRCNNGDTISLTTTTTTGASPTSLRNAIITLINGSGSNFTASGFNVSSFPGKPYIINHYPGLLVANSSGQQCYFSITISGTLSFSQPAYTLHFNEVRDEKEGFDCFVSYAPEMMASINNLLVTFKNGQLWTHNSTLFNNFYGIQYESYITLCFNDNIKLKKTFEHLSYQSNKIWTSQSDGDIYTEDINPQTGLTQISKLTDVDYSIDENIRFADFLRDMNSNADKREGLYNGDYLKGAFIVVKLRYGGSDYAFISDPYVAYNPSVKIF